MTPPSPIERWPPVYDAEDLAATIRRLVESDRLNDQFYSRFSTPHGPFQGDIVRLRSGLPLIGADGALSIMGEYEHWMVIGNTCDIQRDLNDVTWSQVVPLEFLGSDSDLTSDQLRVLRKYSYSRRFYVPDWSPGRGRRHYVADFLRPVTVHKGALREAAQVEARLGYYSWILLHSCLVRFLARDDGRFT